MININYKKTLQDDLDAIETSMEYSLNNLWVKWLLVRGLTTSFILLGSFYIVDGIIHNSRVSNWNIFIGIVLIIIGGIFPLIFNPSLPQSNWSRHNMEKTWSNKSIQEEYRNITLTETELIFKTEFTESACKLKAFKKYFEGNKGFVIWFFSEDNIYIPKRIFENLEALDSFKKKLKYSNYE